MNSILSFGLALVLLGNGDSISASEIVAAYDGPPREAYHLDYAYPALIACNAHFSSGEPVEGILSRIITGTMSEYVGVDLHATTSQRYIKVDSAKRILAFETENYVQRARHYPGYGCGLLTPYRDELYGTFPAIAASKPIRDVWPAGEGVKLPSTTSIFRPAGFNAAMKLLFAPEASTQAIVVIKNGRIVFERYREPYGPDSTFNSYSATKSLNPILIGALEAQGRLSINDYMPIKEWQNDADPRRLIRISDVIRMSSGLDSPQVENAWERHGLANPEDYFLTSDATQSAVLFKSGIAAGTLGAYRDQDPHLLRVVAQRLGEAEGLNLRQLYQRQLLDPLGIPGIEFVMDSFGQMQAHAFALMRPRDWGKLGLLMLRGGRWQDRQVLTPDYVKFAFTPAPGWQNGEEAAAEKHATGLTYGGGIWLKAADARPDSLFGWLPPGSGLMQGFGYQMVMMIPDKDLVVVRFGHVPASEKQSLNARTKELETAEKWEISPGLKLLVESAR
jgi:CubicO group peptidase (beta-lactamase class C family)